MPKMPSFGELIASSVPDDSDEPARTSIRHTRTVSIDAFPFIETPLIVERSPPSRGQTLPLAPEKAYCLPTGQPTIRRSAPAKIPIRRQRYSEATLHKPLPLPPGLDDSDSSSVPDLTDSSSRSSRRSSADSFSHLARASCEIDLFLTTLKTLPIDEDMEVERSPLPGMWSIAAYAPIQHDRPLSIHATPTNMIAPRISIETFLTAQVKAPARVQEAPLPAKQEVFELEADNTPPKDPIPSYDSLFGQPQVSEPADDAQLQRMLAHQRSSSNGSAKLSSLVSPLDGSVALTYEDRSVSRLSSVAELPGDSSSSGSSCGSKKSSSVSSVESEPAELPGEPVGEVQDANKIVQPPAKSVKLPVIRSSHVPEPFLSNPQQRPWKGKGILPPIKTIMWDQVPQSEVGTFCNSYDKPLPLPKRRVTMQDMVKSLQDEPEQKVEKTPVAQRASMPEIAGSATPKPQEPDTAALNLKLKELSERVSKNEARLAAELERERERRLLLKKEREERLKQEEEAKAKAAQAEADRLEREQIREREELEARLAAQRALMRVECVVCGDEKRLDDYPASPPTSKCQHESKICAECLDNWVSSALKDNGTESIKCPECPEKLVYQDVQQATSPKVFEAYDKAATLFALSSLPEFNWCLAPGCGYGQLNVANNNYMECVSCNYKQCLKHQSAWHVGESCAQYDARNSQKAKDEAVTLAMLDKVSKTCPGAGCGWRIQKIDGCDHITCRKCRHEFCWQCLASHKEIKRVGNTAHAKDCKFHSDNLDLAWPFNRH